MPQDMRIRVGWLSCKHRNHKHIIEMPSENTEWRCDKTHFRVQINEGVGKFETRVRNVIFQCNVSKGNDSMFQYYFFLFRRLAPVEDTEDDIRKMKRVAYLGLYIAVNEAYKWQKWLPSQKEVVW